MTAYIGRRVIQMIPVVLLVSIMAFALVFILPGDPARAILGDDALRDQQQYEQLRKDLGLNRPLPVQYADWASHVVRGDFGTSTHTKLSVGLLLTQHIGPTLELAALSMAFALLIAIPVGIISALRPNSKADIFGTLLAIVGASIPHFWFGLLLILFFALRLHWLPPSGYISPSTDLLGNLKLMIMPVVTLGSGIAALVMRQTRSAMLEVLRQEYIVTARAKGLPPRAVVVGHALRNALIPVATVVGLQLGQLIGGAVITENIFSIPGVGSLAASSIFTRDFPVLQAVVLILSVAVLLANLATDVVYACLDPRIHYH